jgi:hypothetical protein
MTDWSKQQLGPIPPVARGGNLDLSEVIGAQGVKEIEDLGEIRFHALGDSGVGNAHEAQQIGDEMATDFKVGAGGLNPAFLFHLGDVIYGNDKGNHYGERFYIPYKHYPGKILAIPGNHDGEVKSPADNPSLTAYRANFCAATAAVPPQASGSGIYRETMTQPGVYWFLDAPFVQIIGLYSNLLENPGYLEGITAGKGDTSQLDWLGQTLPSIAKAKQKKALVIATHHPPFSQSGHSGSTEMSQSIDAVCTKAGVFRICSSPPTPTTISATRVESAASRYPTLSWAPAACRLSRSRRQRDSRLTRPTKSPMTPRCLPSDIYS